MAEADPDIIIPVLPYDTESEDDETADDGVRERRELQRAEELRRLYEDNMSILLSQPPEHHAHSERELHRCPEIYAKLLEPSESCGIDYVDTRSADWDPESFKQRYIAGCMPAMLRGLTDGWRAAERWRDTQAFIEHYGDVPLKVTEVFAMHGFGKPRQLRVPARMYAMARYCKYAEEATADFPYYIFERDMDEERSPLVDDYSVPDVFSDDLYSSTPATRNFLPKERYMVIGPQRTGVRSNMHTDPKYTCAWNALLAGTKRWVLFPPNENPGFMREIGVPSSEMGARVDPPTYWWTDVYPVLKRSGAGERLGMVDCLQKAGETIFVPQGWWHAVLNLDFTIAVTQNSVLPEMLPSVWPRLAVKYPTFAAYFARTVARKRPGLASAIPDLERVAMETAHEGERDDDLYGDYN